MNFTNNILCRKVIITIAVYIFAPPCGAIAQAPVADFTSNITSGCFPITVNFSDLSTNTPTSWLWDFGNGNNSAFQNPSAVYLATGNYTVTLIACNGNGCDTIIKNNYITVFDYPIAGFTSDLTYGCAPLTVQFSDTSTPTSSPIVSWFWNFGDGNVSTAQNPVYTYPVPGIFDVSISVTDSLGCNNSKAESNYIVVSTPPSLSYTMDNSSSCNSPLTVNFTNTSTQGTYPVISWLWDFGDGFTDTVFSPQHTYSNDGSYTVSLTATDSIGCVLTLSDINAVNIGTDTAGFTYTTVRTCSELQVSFSGTSSGNITNWSWNFGDGSPLQSGQNVNHNYTSSGQFTVTLVVTNTGGCTDTASENLSYLKLNAGFFPDTTYSCSLPFTVSFTDTSTGTPPLNWQWDFSYNPSFGFNLESTLQNPSRTYFSEGGFDVMLVVTDTYGCRDTVSLKQYGDSIWILKPDADFGSSPWQGCAPLNVSFTDASNSGMGSITGWQWNFDDPASGANNVSSLQNPSHTFDFVGIYNVKLVITNNLGCVDSIIKTVRTGYPPAADSITKSKSIACHGESVNFTAFSSDPNVNDGRWDWDDGYTGWGWPSATHGFQDTGTLVITFTPIYNGCEGTPIYDTIFILPPKPIFTPSSTFSCRTPFTVTFTNSSWEADTWSWDFGDGSPLSSIWSPSHTYTTPGNHNVTLTVSNSNGCTDTRSRLISIPQPTAGFTGSPLVGCVPLNVAFTDASFTYIPITYPITSWWWDFGDITFSTVKNPNHAYSTTATFTVTHVIQDAAGCTDTLVRTDYISTSATVTDFSASPVSGCPPLTVNFTDQSTPYSPIVSWSWDFGDGSPLNSSQNPTHIYTAPGNFTVRLTITDSIGCVNTMTKSSLITVTKPNVQFTHPPKVCINQPFIFINNTPGSGLSYLWNFGDGDTSSVKNPVHSYSGTGMYSVSLIATDTNGCKDTAISQIESIALPIVSFTVDSFFSLCPPLIVQFTDQSTSANDSIVSWLWDFGDGISASNPNPVHTYAYPDTFDVQLTATNSTGCIDSLLIPDMVTVAGPSGSFSFSPDTGCAPLTVTFNSSTTNTTEFTWDFGDGVVDTSSGPFVVHTYIQPGFPTPQLYITDSMGCKLPATTAQDYYITIDNTIALFSMFPTPLYTPFCPPDTVFFNDSSYTFTDSTQITGWLWDFGDGIFDSVQNPIHIYTDTGIFNINLTVSSSLGCSNDTTVTLGVFLVDSLVLKASIIALTPVTCYGFNDGEATATGISGTPPYTYQWDSVSGNQITATATALVPGTHSVTVTDSMGCIDSTTVLINEPDSLIAFTDTIINVSCAGLTDGSIAASETGGTPPYSYQWDAAAGNQTTPIAGNLPAGVYLVTVTDSNGCVSTLIDTVSEPDTLSISILDTIPVACFGDSTGSAIVSSSGGTQPYSYNWNPAFAGNNDTASNLPAQNYSVTVVDNNGCDTSLNLTITQPTELLVSTTSSDVSCNGGSDGSATANPSGGIPPYTYSWDDGSTQTTQTADSLPAGIWTVTVTDTNGCTVTGTDTIIAPPPLTLVLSKTDVSCYGGNNGSASLTAGGGVPPYSYLWSNGDITAFADTLSAGTWYVTVTDSNNCFIEDSISISQPDSLVISFNKNDVSCNGGNDGSATANVSGGIPPYVYAWNDGSAQTTQTADSLPAGTWEVTVTDSNGCVAADTVTITEPTALSLSTNASDVLCNGGNDGTATVSAIGGGTPPYSYQWNDSLAQTTQTATGLPADTWAVTVTDTNNCTIDTFVVVSEPPLLAADIIEIRTSLCNGESDGELAALGAGGTLQYSYLWSPVNSTAPSIDSLPAGEYILAVTDSHNCQAFDTVTITELTPLVLSIGNDDGSDTICYNNNHQVVAETTGSAPPYTFLWTDGITNYTGNPITVVYDTTQSLFITVTDSAGCTSTDSIKLYINYLQVNLSFEDTVCYEIPTTVESLAGGTLPGYNSNYSYLWNTGQTSSSVQVSALTDTTITVTVTDGCSKEISDSASIFLYPIPDISIQISQTPVCPLSEITFTDTIAGNSGLQHLWGFGDGNNASGITVQHAYSNGGTYWPSLTVFTLQGCANTLTSATPVIIYATPQAYFEADPFVTKINAPVISFTDLSWVQPVMQDAIVSYFWDFGDGETTGDINPTHTFPDTGTFPVTLTVTTQYGCTGEITRDIRINPYVEFSIPNAFTPSPYGSSGGFYDPESYDNDVFYPLTKYVREYLFQIFNRWGELIFESTEHAIGWDGYYRGKLCQQDTYIWKLKIIWTTDEEYKNVGWVLLIQ